MQITATYLSEQDIVRLERALKNERDKLLLRILFETGCNVHELVTIKTGNIRLNKILIEKSETKNKRAREIEVIKETRSRIERFKRAQKPKDYLFHSREGPRLTERRVQQTLKTAAETLGKNVNPRILRKSFVINAFLRKTPIPEIERQIGINSIQPYLYEYLKHETG